MRMDARDHNEVEESLFICNTAGGTWEFVTVRDRGCALLLDGERVTAGDASPDSIERVLNAFLRVSQPRGTAGPRLPVAPPESDRRPGGEPFIRPFR